MKIFKVIAGFFIFLVVVLWMTMQAINTFANWQNSQYIQKKEKKLLEETPEERQSSKELDKDLKKKQLEKLSGFDPKNKGDIMPWDKSYMGIHQVSSAIDEDGSESEGKLIFAPDVSKHYQKILQDIEDWMNDPGHNLQPDEFGDNYSPFLVRNNCILYGAPGTGKTEFARELNRALIERYGGQAEVITDPDDPNYGLQDASDQEKKAKIPIFVINGERCQTGGSTVGDINTHEKLARIILHLKREFFGDENSQEPYIVFVDEADQAKNTVSYKAGSCLEEWKNLLSVANDSQGLSSKINPAQDRNSIIIIATNNYDDIDPAITRRGRLGVKLNFTWNPLTLKQYGEQQGIVWPQLNGHDDPNWKFADNREYQVIFKLTNKFGFAMLREKFVPKTQQILQDWLAFRNNTLTYRSKVEKELGAEEKYYCSSCGGEAERETPEQYQKRVNEAVKNGTQGMSGDQRASQEAIILQQQREIRHCRQGHNAELICNWLLHYLHTFLLYFGKQDLDSFTRAEQIKRYEFGDNQLLRERIRELGNEMFNTQSQIGNQIGQSLAQVVNTLKEIKEEINSAEIQALRNSVNELESHLSQAEGRMRFLESSLDSLRSDISQLSSQATSAAAQARAAASSSTSSGGGSTTNITYSGGLSSHNKNQLLSIVQTIESEINSIIQSLGSFATGLTGFNPYSNLQNRVSTLTNMINSL